MSKKTIFFLSVFLVLGVAVGFGLGYGYAFPLGKKSVKPQIVFGVSNPEEGKPENVDFSLFWGAWATLQEEFVNKGKLDYQKMLYGAISGMTDSIGDPYTVFLTPEENKRFNEDVSGKFEGLGMEVGIRKGELTVIAPLEGTPAQKAGLRPGDKIWKINDTITADLSIDEAVDLMRGPKGTNVKLTVFRKEWDNPKEFNLTREVINVPSLKWELKENNIAYLRLYSFNGNVAEEFNNNAFAIFNSPAKKIILDLRGNTGGYLGVATEIAGWFLDQGQVILIEDLGNGERKEYKAQGNELFSKYPIVVLTDEGSASASEILAAALRDNRGAKLIGQKSFGKGAVQQMFELSNGSWLKITIANWLTPKGDTIHEKGLEPDIKVELTEDDINNNRDPQLDKAIEIIKGL